MMLVEYDIPKEEEAFTFFTLYHESGHGVLHKVISDKDKTLLKRVTDPGKEAEYAADIFALWVTRFFDKSNFDKICAKTSTFKLPGDGIEHPTQVDRIKALDDSCLKLTKAKDSENKLEDLEALIKNFLDKNMKRRMIRRNK